MSQQPLYDFENDFSEYEMFRAHKLAQHREQQRAKFTGEARRQGRWIQNNPLPVLIVAFIGLTALCTATDKPTNQVPKQESAQVASLGK